jgi:hypothetical protein
MRGTNRFLSSFRRQASWPLKQTGDRNVGPLRNGMWLRSCMVCGYIDAWYVGMWVVACG